MTRDILDDFTLDDFTDLSGWHAITSGQARLAISRDAGRRTAAMRLDFDFQGGGGFVVARKPCALALPESYVFAFGIRGEGPRNILEFKLADASNQNVWRYREESFELPREWQELRLASRQIGFAWGPLGGGPAREVAALELVIAAGPGGRGTVWIDDLRLIDTSYRLTPVVTATSALPGREPQQLCAGAATSGWRSADGDAPQRLTLDFQCEREYGGLSIQWDPQRRPARLTVQLSSDGVGWQTCFSADQGVGPETHVYLPAASSRYVQLDLEPTRGGEGVGIRAIEVQPHAFSASRDDFFGAIAQRARPGLHPKYLLGRQTYWTPVGTGEDVTQALFDEQGMVEVDKGSWSLEPYLYADGQLVTWADVELSQGLEQGYLPIPHADWRAGELRLRITACALGVSGDSALLIRYQVANDADRARAVSLFAAIRPFQVTPTWQHWEAFGGAAAISALEWDGSWVCVNATKRIIPLTAAGGFGAATFAQGAVSEFLVAGELPAATRLEDPFGHASGALRFALELPARAVREVALLIPFGDCPADRAARWSRGASGPELFARARSEWQARLNAFDIQLPPAAAEVVATLRTAAAHILINRDGPALHPGPRRYSRAWIRDGALMGAALARLGQTAAGGDFIRWYADFQTADGNLPDCADRDGQEWLPEFDAWGEFIFAVMDHYRFSGDAAFLAELWPAVLRCVDYLEALRNQRLTPDYAAPERLACRGLLPESMSHEGYMAHPVHAYWDDFWALRGLKDATAMAERLGEPVQSARLAALRDDFRQTLQASLARVIGERGLDFVPGSVELADFDPAATAIAVTIADELQTLPRPAIEQTFAKYLSVLRARIAGTTDWSNYTAYEIRILGALVRLGWRREAHELLDFILADRRIRPWNQWPEISWRDPRGPSFIGDMPHTWIGAEYILAVHSLFAYPRAADLSLVIAAGVAEHWLADGAEVAVRDLPTEYGRIGYRLRRETPDSCRITLTGEVTLPAGGCVLMPPLPGPLTQVRIDGRSSTDFGPDWARCHDCPAEILLRHRPRTSA